jgi:hypothetical protein
VRERAAAVGFLLHHDLVDETTGLHAAEREEAVGPGVGALAEELADAIASDPVALGGGERDGSLLRLGLGAAAVSAALRPRFAEARRASSATFRSRAAVSRRSRYASNVWRALRST